MYKTFQIRTVPKTYYHPLSYRRLPDSPHVRASAWNLCGERISPQLLMRASVIGSLKSIATSGNDQVFWSSRSTSVCRCTNWIEKFACYLPTRNWRYAVLRGVIIGLSLPGRYCGLLENRRAIFKPSSTCLDGCAMRWCNNRSGEVFMVCRDYQLFRLRDALWQAQDIRFNDRSYPKTSKLNRLNVNSNVSWTVQRILMICPKHLACVHKVWGQYPHRPTEVVPVVNRRKNSQGSN